MKNLKKKLNLSVGEEVIRRQWKDYKKWNNIKIPDVFQTWMNNHSNLPKAIACDIDGTLAHKSPNRDIYQFEKAGEDIIAQPIRDIISGYSDRLYKVIIISAREEKYRDVTEKWLKKNGVVFDKFFMRKTGDQRKDWIVKEEIYKNQIEPYYHLEGVFDDRKQVCDMWRRNNLLVFQVAEGNY